MYKNCYGICFTPNTYNSYINHWVDFIKKYNANIILDNSHNLTIDYECFKYTESDIRKNFNFNLDVSKNHYWNSYGNKNIIWFYAYLRMINFYISHPNHEYYWFFDDDVYCDNWEEFFQGFENDESDFLSYFIFKNTNVESYQNIPKVNNKMFSGESWFNRFPGDQDILLNNTNEYFGSFFAIVRLSNRALKEIVNVTKNGFSGYGEGFIPTTMAKLGYKINTIYNSDNTSNYFNINKVDIKHKNQKINWEWL
jgi:hypothetical protein